MTLLFREWSCYWNSFYSIFDNWSFLRPRKMLSYSIIKCNTKHGHAFFPLIPFFWHCPVWPTKKLSFHAPMSTFSIWGCWKLSSAICEQITVFSNQHNSQSVFTNIILFDVKIIPRLGRKSYRFFFANEEMERGVKKKNVT